MAVDQNTRQFVLSWLKAKDYPLNLVGQGYKSGTLRAHRRLLDATAAELFNPRNGVVVIELDEEFGLPARLRVVTSENELYRWLVIPSEGGNSPSSPTQSTGGVAQTSPATIRCRFIFFRAASGQARLDVTRDLACMILTYFQVMPSYIDYMTVFAVKIGAQVDASDLRFSGFKERLLLSPNASGLRGLGLPQLGLSGRCFHICFNLKSVFLKKAVGVKERWQWSPRQAVFHHQFDAGHGTSLWIITSARDDIQKRVQELVGENGDEEDRSFDSPAKSFISSLAVHTVLAQWASEDWRGYIRWLEQVLEEKTIDALRSDSFVPSSADISFVQKKEDDTNRVTIMLRANAGILKSIADFYQELVQNINFALWTDPDCQRAVADFLLEIRDYIHEFQLLVDRAQTLRKITTDRKNLVQYRLQAHATAKMEVMTHQAQKEAVTMRIIAVVTLIYLPATFVSTLFSTDIVKYQNVDGKESYSSLALGRWFALTIPLTFVTFAIAGGWLARHKITAFFSRSRRSREFDPEKLD